MLRDRSHTKLGLNGVRYVLFAVSKPVSSCKLNPIAACNHIREYLHGQRTAARWNEVLIARVSRNDQDKRNACSWPLNCLFRALWRSFLGTWGVASKHNPNVIRLGELILMVPGYGELLSIRREFRCFGHVLAAVSLDKRNQLVAVPIGGRRKFVACYGGVDGGFAVRSQVDLHGLSRRPGHFSLKEISITSPCG